MERHSTSRFANVSHLPRKKVSLTFSPWFWVLVTLLIVGFWALSRAGLFHQTAAVPASVSGPVVPVQDSTTTSMPAASFKTTEDLSTHPMFAPLVGNDSDSLPMIFLPEAR